MYQKLYDLPKIKFTKYVYTGLKLIWSFWVQCSFFLKLIPFSVLQSIPGHYLLYQKVLIRRATIRKSAGTSELYLRRIVWRRQYRYGWINKYFSRKIKIHLIFWTACVYLMLLSRWTHTIAHSKSDKVRNRIIKQKMHIQNSLIIWVRFEQLK